MEKKQEKMPKKTFVKILWRLFILGLLFIVAIFTLANFGVFGEMPTFKELEHPTSSQATEVISADGKTIGKFYSQNRVAVKYKDLPKHLVDALVATEDERFYSHSGIDARGTLRAVVKAGTNGGASTISQQLAKNLFHGSQGSRNIFMRIIQKIKEWIIAVKIERQYTKQEIIAHYLNTVDFVNNAYGIKSAANIYFGKEPKDLTVEESAVLIGMLKAPSKYNPKSSKKNSKKRRNIVLSQMNKNGYLSDKEKKIAQNKPLEVNFTPETHTKGFATYFREYLREYLKKWVKENPKADGTTYDIYRDGLRIYTTIDYKMQKYAEKAVKKHLSNLQKEFFKQTRYKKNAPFVKISKKQTNKIIKRAMKLSERWRQMTDQGKTESQIIKSFDIKRKMRVFTWNGERDTIMTPRDSIIYYKHFLQTGMISMEPTTGHIKAWVGGINNKFFQYDHVIKGARQVGSTFKPFVYGTAIKNLQMSPCDYILDDAYTMKRGTHGLSRSWSPKNAGRYHGHVSMKFALANSLNTVTARLMEKVGPKSVVELCTDLGIKSNIPILPAIALGAVEITVHDMAAAYSAFANQGIYVKPSFITKITDKNGVVIYETETESKAVMNKDVAYAVINLMEGVTKTGSGSRLRATSKRGGVYRRVTGFPYGFKNPIAGKTGTTQNNSDGWFIGMVPNLTTAVWVGNEDRSAHFKSTAYGQGATMALPIWALYMKQCYNDSALKISKSPFKKPKNMHIELNCSRYSPPIIKDSVSDVKNDSLTISNQNAVDEFDF